MPIITIVEAIWDLTKMALSVAFLYFALGAYVLHRQPRWVQALHRHRMGVLWMLVLAVLTIKVGEDVLGGESGPIDKSILVLIHDLVPSGLNAFFAAVTFTASGRVLTPLTVVVTFTLLMAKRRFEALLLAASVIVATALVYVLKTLVGRARPALWDTEWYWGSSFPSGHTLVVAAFAMAVALGTMRIRPQARGLAVSMALSWISLVALSRLVLGVHWPTDVLAAACVGMLLPLAMNVALESRRT
jgi:undecaprenyl-diphosphatase